MKREGRQLKSVGRRPLDGTTPTLEHVCVRLLPATQSSLDRRA